MAKRKTTRRQTTICKTYT